MTPEDRDEMQFPDHRPREEQPKWRRDFPIDVPEDHYVSRRDFTKFMVLTSGAFVVGHLWIGAQAALRKKGPMEPRALVALADLPVGAVRQFHYPGEHDPCLLVRLSEDLLVAYSQKCTHLSCAVQPEFEKGRFACPCHHAFFDMASGSPLSGPPRRPLPRILLEVRDGTVYAAGVELRT